MNIQETDQANTDSANSPSAVHLISDDVNAQDTLTSKLDNDDEHQLLY